MEHGVLFAGFAPLAFLLAGPAEAALAAGQRIAPILTDKSRCISYAHDALTIDVSTMRLEKRAGFWRKDKSFASIFGLRPFVAGSAEETVKYPRKLEVNVSGEREGFIEAGLSNATLANQFRLSEDRIAHTAMEIDVTFAKTRGEGGVRVLRALLNAIPEVPLPGNPYTAGLAQFSKTINGVLGSLAQEGDEEYLVASGAIPLQFSKEGDECSDEGPYAKDGPLMIVFAPASPPEAPAGFVDVTRISDYCFKIDNRLSFLPKFSEKRNDVDCKTTYAQMTPMKNAYIGFYLQAQRTTTLPAKKAWAPEVITEQNVAAAFYGETVVQPAAWEASAIDRPARAPPRIEVQSGPTTVILNKSEFADLERLRDMCDEFGIPAGECVIDASVRYQGAR